MLWVRKKKMGSNFGLVPAVEKEEKTLATRNKNSPLFPSAGSNFAREKEGGSSENSGVPSKRKSRIRSYRKEGEGGGVESSLLHSQKATKHRLHKWEKERASIIYEEIIAGEKWLLFSTHHDSSRHAAAPPGKKVHLPCPE